MPMVTKALPFVLKVLLSIQIMTLLLFLKPSCVIFTVAHSHSCASGSSDAHMPDEETSTAISCPWAVTFLCWGR